MGLETNHKTLCQGKPSWVATDIGKLEIFGHAPCFHATGCSAKYDSVRGQQRATTNPANFEGSWVVRISTVTNHRESDRIVTITAAFRRTQHQLIQ